MIALNFDVLGGNNYSHTGTGLLRHIDRRVDGKRVRPIRRDNAVKCKISINLICWNAQRRGNVTRYAVGALENLAAENRIRRRRIIASRKL